MPNLESSLNIVKEKTNYFTLVPFILLLKIQQTLYKKGLCAVPIENSLQYNYIVYSSNSDLTECSRFFIDTYKYKFHQLFQ